jgi:hypothetical protein
VAIDAIDEIDASGEGPSGPPSRRAPCTGKRPCAGKDGKQPAPTRPVTRDVLGEGEAGRTGDIGDRRENPELDGSHGGSQEGA